MDYYKVLGLHKNATKSEIKDAFRKLAVKFHPDKHTASTKGVKDSATLRFKQVSEAYDVLSDDRKRADYNLRQSGSGFASRTSSSSYNGHGYQSRNTNSDYNKYYYSDYRKPSGGFALKFEIFARYLTSRDFLLHAAFVSILLGGAIIIDKGRGVLWKLQNSGKSFEDAMDNIEKAKADKDKV